MLCWTGWGFRDCVVAMWYSSGPYLSQWTMQCLLSLIFHNCSNQPRTRVERCSIHVCFCLIRPSPRSVERNLCNYSNQSVAQFAKSHFIKWPLIPHFFTSNKQSTKSDQMKWGTHCDKTCACFRKELEFNVCSGRPWRFLKHSRRIRILDAWRIWNSFFTLNSTNIICHRMLHHAAVKLYRLLLNDRKI